MSTLRRSALLTTWLFLLSASLLEAAKWGPNGHPRITYDAACDDEFDVPTDLARVIALGSIAPDYFELDNPAAHAQTPDPALTRDRHHFRVSSEQQDTYQRNALANSVEWHNRYLAASVQEMKSGHRERAAFLLGYAMHNAEDLGTHGGMSNLVHSAMAVGGNDPDMDFQRLEVSRELAALDLSRFRREIGETNWHLFRGESVRGPGVGSRVPEPLTRFDLQNWNPYEGLVSPRPEDERLRDLVDAVLVKYDEPGYPLYSADVRGKMQESDRARLENLFFGLHQRQQAMLDILVGVDPTLEAPDPVAYAGSLSAFVQSGRIYAGLGQHDMETLQHLEEWKKYVAEKRLERKRERREGAFADRWVDSARPFESALETRELQFASQLHEEERRQRWVALSSWVHEACGYVKSPLYSDGTGLEAALEKRRRDYLLGHYVVMSDEEIEQGLAKSGGDLDPCESKLINAIRQATGPIDPDWLLAQFDQNRPHRTRNEGPGLLGSRGEKFDQALAAVVRGIGDGMVNLAHGIKKPFIYVKEAFEASDDGGTTAKSSSGSSHDGRTDSDHSQSRGTDLGVAHRQLKGIAGSNGGFPGR